MTYLTREATERALEMRGLISRKFWVQELQNGARMDVPIVEPFEHTSMWDLTPVGEAMVNMLKVGGVFIEAEAAQEKQGRRRRVKAG